MRVHRPFGIFPLLFPCWWGLALSPGVPEAEDLILFALGAFIMRSAGCIINDLWDKNIDRQVERTKIRPLAAGDLSTLQALCLLALLLSLGLAVLLSFPTNVILLGASSLILVITYPLMKRITYWPQLFLGLTFNWGVLLGGLVYNERLSAPWYLFYLAGILWTIGYDTIYAHQDRHDDDMIGVKSTALLFGEKTKTYLLFFYGTAFILMLLGGLFAGKGIFFGLMMLGTAAHFIWQINTLDINDSQNCHQRFASNSFLGGWIFICLLL